MHLTSIQINGMKLIFMIELNFSEVNGMGKKATDSPKTHNIHSRKVKRSTG